MEIVNVHQMGLHEVEELAVGVDEDDIELLALAVELQRFDICRQLPVVTCNDGQFTLVVQLHLVLGGRLGFLLRILQCGLHLSDAGNDL